MWTRPASFSTLILIILEQQVSLASAYAAFKKLKEKVGTVTPKKLMALTDAELRACYFSRQKTIYARELAQAVLSKKLRLGKFNSIADDFIREELKEIKGIGDWTVDIYLIHALQRSDIFPLGDLALIKSIKEIKALPHHTSKEQLQRLSERYRPYRSIATMIFWHAYIQKRGIKIID
jgi:DNA-3-methyladenine glycosylase II